MMLSPSSLPKPHYTVKKSNEGKSTVSSHNGCVQGAMRRSKSQDLRKFLLTASLSISCPDLLEERQYIGSQSRTESCDLLVSRLGGATQRSRTLGIGLHSYSPHTSTDGSLRASPSLSKVCQDSSGDTTPISSRRVAAASTGSKGSPTVEEATAGGLSPSSTHSAECEVRLSPQGENIQSSSEQNGHIILHRTKAQTNASSTSNGNSRCSTAVFKSDDSCVNVLKLTKENLSERTCTKARSTRCLKEKSHFAIENKKENKSFLKNLFGFKKKTFLYSREFRSSSIPKIEDKGDIIPETMTRAQYERCCQWLEEVEQAKTKRCMEVSTSPPPVWSE